MTTLTALFIAATAQYDLPPQLLESICFIESHHNPDARHHDDGGTDSLGVCQIKYATAKWLGYTGSEQDLMRPEINIHFSAKYLARNLRRYKGDVTRAVIAYNRGSAGDLISTAYSDKVMAELEYRRINSVH